MIVVTEKGDITHSAILSKVPAFVMSEFAP